MWNTQVYDIKLKHINRGDEAREFLTKLLSTSKQVFGSDHNITKGIEADEKMTIEQMMCMYYRE